MQNNPQQHTSLKHRFMMQVLVPIAVCILRFIGWTLRVTLEDPHRVSPEVRNQTKVIYAFWHNQQLLSTVYFRNYNIQVLVSRSLDGDYIAKALSSFGFGTVRSSTSQGRVNALRGLVRELQAQHHVAITPDGPRGPVYQAQAGAIYLAALSGHAVVPFGCATEKVWKLRSWDGFEIPKPFSRAAIVFGQPMQVPRKITDQEAQDLTRNLEQQLNALHRAAQDRLAVPAGVKK